MAALIWNDFPSMQGGLTGYQSYLIAYDKETGFRYRVKTYRDEDNYLVSELDIGDYITDTIMGMRVSMQLLQVEGDMDTAQMFNNFITENFIRKYPNSESTERTERVITL